VRSRSRLSFTLRQLNIARKELVDLQRKYNILRSVPAPSSLSSLTPPRSIHVKREKTERQKLKDSLKLKTSSSTSAPNASGDDEDLTAPQTPTTHAATAPAAEKDPHPDTASVHSGSEISQHSKASLPVSGSVPASDATLSISDDKSVLHWGKLKRKKRFATTRGQFSSSYFVLKTDGFLYYYHVSYPPPSLAIFSFTDLCQNAEDIGRKNGENGKWDVKKCVSMVDPKDDCRISITLTGKKVLSFPPSPPSSAVPRLLWWPTPTPRRSNG
jgi:hypothetical protein